MQRVSHVPAQRNPLLFLQKHEELKELLSLRVRFVQAVSGCRIYEGLAFSPLLHARLRYHAVTGNVGVCFWERDCNCHRPN